MKIKATLETSVVFRSAESDTRFATAGGPPLNGKFTVRVKTAAGTYSRILILRG